MSTFLEMQRRYAREMQVGLRVIFVWDDANADMNARTLRNIWSHNMSGALAKQCLEIADDFFNCSGYDYI